jgi:mono/diheme cytochrome c family protein
VLVVDGCHGDVAGGEVDGAKIFERACTMCHGPTGKPDAAMVARIGVKDLTSPELRARITPALVAKQVRAGSRQMPAFQGALTEQQIEAVASYVASPQFLERK